MAAQANGAPLGPVTLTPEMLDPFNSPWRPPRDLSDPMDRRHSPALAADTVVVETRAPVAAALESSPSDFNAAVAELEKRLIETALATCRGHQRKAADHLGLSYHQMRGLLRKYGYGRGAADETATDSGTLEKPSA
jgi:psp operon transcriptional activator